MNTAVHPPKYYSLIRRGERHSLVYVAAVLVSNCGDPNSNPPTEPTITETTAPTPSQTSTSADSSGAAVGPTSSAPSTTASTSLPGTSTAPTTGNTSGPPANVPTLEEISQILVFTCGNIICHMPPPYEPPDFSRTDDALYTLLTTYTAARCQNAPLVVPGDAAASAIIKAVTNDCGGFYMPPDTYFPFTEEELAKVTAWINAGAPNQ